MKSPLLYLIEALFCSGVLLAFYRLLLVRRVSFRACRRYLLAALALSVVIPALDIPLYPAPEPIPGSVAELVFPVPAAAHTEERDFAAVAAREPLQPEPVDRRRLLRGGLAAVYGAVVAVSLGFLVVRLVRLRRLRRRAHLTPCKGYTLAESPQVPTPFSFLCTVYMGPGYEGERREMVLCHEASHVRHGHSVENLFAETVRCLLWINPFVWMAQRWLREVHEWEADRDVLDAGYDLTRYRIVLFHQLFGYNPDIACGLNHSLTKTRFAMMTRFRKRRHTALRFGAAIPVVAGMMMLCSFTTRDPEPPAATPRPAADDAPRLEVCLSRDSMWIDGTPGTGADLQRRISEKRDSLSEEERSRMTVTIRAARQVQMGAVADVKELLREAGALRVCYETVDGRAGIARLLPPRIETLPDTSNAKVEVWELSETVPGDSKYPDSYHLKIAERNYFMVLINARGEILAGTWGHLESCDVEALKVRAREFMLNPSDDRTLSESRPQEILLPDGRTEQYGVSRGVFGIQTTRKTPYAVYTDVQQALSEVYAGLRTDLSRQWFGQPFDALDEAQRRSVQQAVPVRISEVSRNFATK